MKKCPNASNCAKLSKRLEIVPKWVQHFTKYEINLKNITKVANLVTLFRIVSQVDVAIFLDPTCIGTFKQKLLKVHKPFKNEIEPFCLPFQLSIKIAQRRHE